jgi:hypothetical protein
MWTVKIEPIDSAPIGAPAPDLDAAITRALSDRADLRRARKDIDSLQTNVRFASNQRLPDVRVNASYQASGLGGTQVLRVGGFPGTIVGGGANTDFNGAQSAVQQLLPHVVGWRACRIRSARRGRGQLRARSSNVPSRINGSSVKANASADPLCRLADRDERGNRDARVARELAEQLSTQNSARGRHLDQFPGHPGAARSAQARPTN